MKIIILAGGTGSRLWPLSREKYPKQFIKLMDRKYSLFQETFARSALLANLNDIYVVTNKDYKFLVMGEIEELEYCYPEENILVEPEAKNTLPAIYAGVDFILKRGGNSSESIVVFPSDHLIKRSREFITLINSAAYLSGSSLITFGIKPTLPHTGYGYISPGESIGKYGYAVREFKEKPDYQTAVGYISKGYYWNSGIFMFNSKIFLEEAAKYSPEIVEAFREGANLGDAFSRIKTKISIDYGVMEKSSRVVVVPADIGWSDLGSFDSFYEVFKSKDTNIVSGKDHILVDCSNNLVHSEKGKLVAMLGIEGLIIIDNRDALLVCKKEQSQKVREIVNALKEKKDVRAEYHIRDYRPWGNYLILEEEKDAFKVKRIKINPGKRISYQLHRKRSEHWIVVAGIARITIDGEDRIIRAGESVDIKAGRKHRLANAGKSTLEIIEVQMGKYLEEDDIVRFDDEYGRS